MSDELYIELKHMILQLSEEELIKLLEFIKSLPEKQ